MDELEKVIEVCNNLIGTINKLPLERRKPRVFENEMFNPPLVERRDLLKKLKKFKIKYNLKDEDLNPVLSRK